MILRKLFLLPMVLWMLSCGTEPTSTYTITTSANPNDGGSVSYAPTGSSQDEGTSITFTATPSEGYLFSQWQGDLSGSTNPASITLTKNVSVTAVFEKRTYPLTISIEGEGTVKEEVIQAKTDYEYGTTVRITAQPAEGWKFAGWSGDIESFEQVLEVTIKDKVELIALFEVLDVELKIFQKGNGLVTVNPLKEYYIIGDSVQFIAVPDYGYRLQNWNYDDQVYHYDTIKISVKPDFKVYVEFENGEWISKAFPLDGVNKTVEMNFQNIHSPGFYETNESSLEKGYHILNYERSCLNPITLQCDCNSKCFMADYRFWDPSKTYLDLNNDGLLDMFAFLTRFKEGEVYAKNNGKALIVFDVLGPNPKHKITDIDNRWMPRIYVTDIQNDGNIELFLGGEEDHMLQDGTRGDPRPIRYLSFTEDGSFQINYFGPFTVYHDLAMGDIDNDGDIDILISGRQSDAINLDGFIFSRLILYLNNGGIFEYTDQEKTFKNYIEALGGNDWRYSQEWAALDLFDLDGDGWLDLIGGNGYNHPEQNLHPNPKVLWNQGDGTFDMFDYFELPHKVDFENYKDPHPLGFNVIDYNEDGLLDIITSITPDYGGYIIQIHKNNGDRTFDDVTKDIIIGYQDTYERGKCISGTASNNFSDGDPSNFYNLRPIDKDGDGDYDLVPDQMGGWECDFSQDIYWENRGGKFFRSY